MYKIKKMSKRQSIYSSFKTTSNSSRNAMAEAHIAYSLGRQVSNDIRNISNNMLYNIAKVYK